MALALLDQDARLCGKVPLDSASLNFMLQRLPPNYFLNRHRREIEWARKPGRARSPDIYRDLLATVGRGADHWMARAASFMEDAQEDAKLFAYSLRLENSYLWYLVGAQVRSLNPSQERIYWRVQRRGFEPMSL